MLTFDGANRRIICSTGTTSVTVAEIWSRWCDWLGIGENSKWPTAMRSVGGDTIDAGAGTRIPIYTYLLNGWKVQPQAANHTLTVTNGILLVDGGGDPFVSPAGAYSVRVNYQQPVQAIAVSTSGEGGSGGGLTADQAAMLESIAKIHGLIPGVPVVVSRTQQQAGDITIAMTEAVDGTVTATRQ
jgi:hypothetical protein